MNGMYKYYLQDDANLGKAEGFLQKVGHRAPATAIQYRLHHHSQCSTAQKKNTRHQYWKEIDTVFLRNMWHDVFELNNMYTCYYKQIVLPCIRTSSLQEKHHQFVP